MSRKKDKEDLPENVRKRGKGYTYRYSIEITLPDGKKERKQKETPQYATPDEAYKAGVLIEAQLIQGVYVDPVNSLFEPWASKMLEYHIKVRKLRYSTADVYRILIKIAYGYFSNKKVKDIDHGAYQDFIIWLKDVRKSSSSTIETIHAIMSSIFKHGVKRGQFSKSPCDGADIPRDVPDEDDDSLDVFEEEDTPNFLEHHQLKKLLDATKQLAAQETDTRKAFEWRQMTRLIYVLAHTGMRIGESCGLELEKLDAKQRTIKITRTLYARKGIENYKLGPTKSKKSKRIIDISKRVADVLESQIKDTNTIKLLSGAKYHKERSFIFISTDLLPGWPLNPKKVLDDLPTALKAAGLPEKYITPHGLRHTYTSLSAEAGASLDDIQRQLGHESDTMTKRVYLHVTEERRKANVDKLDALIGDLL